MKDQLKTPGAMVLVPRQLLQCAYSSVAYLALRGDDVGTSNVPTADALRALLDTVAEQTPAVGGEPEVLGYRIESPEGPDFAHADTQLDLAYIASLPGWEVKPLIDRAHIAPLLTELKALKHLKEYVTRPMRERCAERDALLTRIAELEAQQGEPVAYADPKAFDNFKSGIATHEWMWAFPDNGLQPLYRQAQPDTAKVDEWTEFTRAFPDADQRAGGTFIHSEDENKWAAWQARAQLNP